MLHISTKRILKYRLLSGCGNPGKTTIKCKFDKVLTVQMQDGEPTVWILTDSDADEVSITVFGVGTGWEFSIGSYGGGYIGTVQDNYGYVWHYFLSNDE